MDAQIAKSVEEINQSVTGGKLEGVHPIAHAVQKAAQVCLHALKTTDKRLARDLNMVTQAFRPHATVRPDANVAIDHLCPRPWVLAEPRRLT
jgi:hypothetical protein